jgi:hypothetical protein
LILVRSDRVELRPELLLVRTPPSLGFCWLSVESLLALDWLIAAFVIDAIAVEDHSYGS